MCSELVAVLHGRLVVPPQLLKCRRLLVQLVEDVLEIATCLEEGDTRDPHDVNSFTENTRWEYIVAARQRMLPFHTPTVVKALGIVVYTVHKERPIF